MGINKFILAALVVFISGACSAATYEKIDNENMRFNITVMSVENITGLKAKKKDLKGALASMEQDYVTEKAKLQLMLDEVQAKIDAAKSLGIE